MSIQIAVIIDICVVLICAALLLRFGRLAHSHPAIAYLIYHGLVVSLRLISISAGAPTLYNRRGGFDVVTFDEIIRASILTDAALVVMTIAWLMASRVELRKDDKPSQPAYAPPVTLSLSHIWLVAIFVFPIGLFSLATLGNIPGVDTSAVELGEWGTSSWIAITMTWSGLAVLALMYWYGLRWWLSIPMAFYLMVMAVQGYHRFRVVIAVILMIQIYLDRRRMKWPPVWIMVLMISLVLLFFPMKMVGNMIQHGATFSEISASSSELMSQVLVGQAEDQQVLDQTASAMTLVDRAGKYYYGRPYLNLLTSPIPRQWWPGKPILSDHIRDFSTPARPMFQMGMNPGFIGDLYLNFGYLGVLILSYLVAYWLGRAYFKAYRGNYFSVKRFIYLVVACNFIQVYRDGLLSLVVFTLVNMMPLTIIAILHYFRPVRRPTRRKIRLRLAAPSPQRKKQILITAPQLSAKVSRQF